MEVSVTDRADAMSFEGSTAVSVGVYSVSDYQQAYLFVRLE